MYCYGLPLPVGVGYSLWRDPDGVAESTAVCHRFEKPVNAVFFPNQFVTATESAVCRRAGTELVDTAQFMSIIIFCQLINVA
jgi:hypothetical protein